MMCIPLSCARKASITCSPWKVGSKTILMKREASFGTGACLFSMIGWPYHRQKAQVTINEIKFNL